MSSIKTLRSLGGVLPQITKFGFGDVMLESSIKPEIKITAPSTIRILKQVAFKNKIVSLSANQIGLEQRVFVALKSEYMKAGKWRNYQEEFEKFGLKNGEDAYEAIIAPLQLNSTYEQYFGYEECPSFEGFRFKVKIPIYFNLQYVSQKILHDYLSLHPIDAPPKLSSSQQQPIKLLTRKQLNIQRRKQIQLKQSEQKEPSQTTEQFLQQMDKKLQQELKKPRKKSVLIEVPESMYCVQKITGFKGRVWDHEIRHLEGIMPIYEEVCNTQFFLLEDFKNSEGNIDFFERQLEFQKYNRKSNAKNVSKQIFERMKSGHKSDEDKIPIDLMVPQKIRQQGKERLKKLRSKDGKFHEGEENKLKGMVKIGKKGDKSV